MSDLRRKSLETERNSAQQGLNDETGLTKKFFITSIEK